ncbi:hypothetical protein BG015_009446 [Linnemannia schmuckeri]|uniref:Uncharacterized protein n=1 Tax=Linnemannia schmuckeri TaxID=64567 RepID=A0A9P5V9S3_9FUNG|nr:hypothetical protein BG015_009446 [Linnemannia schmuckeri]
MAKVTIQGKITSKKISTWLKSTFQHHSVLAISPPEDRLLQQDDDQDHLDNHIDLGHPHDADGYLSDSSFLSHGEIIEPYSTENKTRPPLRRAISLEDLANASVIHHHLHSSRLLPRNSTNSLHNSSRAVTVTRPRAKSNAAALLLHPLSSPPIRPASAASEYHRHHQHRSSFTTEAQEISYEPLKGRSQSSMALQDQGISNTRRPQPIIVPTQDSREAQGAPLHPSLPTPEVSPEELSSESSDDMVIVDGDLLEESKSVLGLDYYMRSTGQLRQQTYPGAVASGGRRATTGMSVTADARTIDGTSIDGGLEAVTGSWNWLTDSPFLDALFNWIEGPDTATQPKGQDKDNKPNPWLDIPFQFIALLTYPEPDPKNGNKMTLAMVRETSFVRQRRKTLMMLTAYTLVVRYCSFDFFILVLFASNCAMLFLMKNSGRMNVNMAKRAVRQRVGWAKQWAGSIFKRGGNNNSNIAASHHGHSHNASGGHHRTHSFSMSHISNSNLHYHSQQQPSSAAHSARSSPAPLDGTTATSAETSPQMKRRGLFGKRVPINSFSASTYTQGTAISSASAPLLSGDNASVLNTSTTTVATTTRRRFFRRNQNGSNNNNSITTITGATSSTPSAPVPIPTNANTISRHQPSQSITLQRGLVGTIATTPPRSTTAIAATTSTTTNVMHTPQLSSSPLSQSQSLPQQFSPLKPFNVPMLTSDTEMEQADARWATRSGLLTMTPPPVLLPSSTNELNSTANNNPAFTAVSASTVTGQTQTTTVPSSSSSSVTSSPKVDGANSEDLLSPIPIPLPFNTTAATGSSVGYKQGPLVLSGLSQLLSRSSSTSPLPTAATIDSDEDALGSGGQDRYGEALSTTTPIGASAGTLDAVTSAATGIEGV